MESNSSLYVVHPSNAYLNTAHVKPSEHNLQLQVKLLSCSTMSCGGSTGVCWKQFFCHVLPNTVSSSSNDLEKDLLLLERRFSNTTSSIERFLSKTSPIKILFSVELSKLMATSHQMHHSCILYRQHPKDGPTL